MSISKTLISSLAALTIAATSAALPVSAEDDVFCDLTNDNKVTAEDATALLIDFATGIANGRDSGTLSLEKADANGDGKITAEDATLMLIDFATGLANGKNYGVVERPDAYSYVYGTMNIPYDEFYKSEKITSETVDAVSSATTSKWKMNQEGGLVEGSYNEANADGKGGKILGVTYPVAILKSGLKKLGDKNYSFKETKDKADAYKKVSVKDGKAAFSEVIGKDTEVKDVEATITADTPWGDYLVNPVTKDKKTYTPDGPIYGAVLTTKEGHNYAMCHLSNIWRGEFAWSSGFTTVEPHKNPLPYENYKSLMGETITSIKYITKSGYQTLKTNLFVPIKTKASVKVEDATAGTGSSTVTLSDLPTDYKPSFVFADIKGNNVNTITTDGKNAEFKGALAGTYTLTVSDTSKKYADFKTTFTLKSTGVAAVAGENALVKAENVTDAEFANYIANIADVKVTDSTGKETKYSNGRGRGKLLVIKDDGTVDTKLTSGKGDAAKPVFTAGTYTLVITANGYDDITLNVTIA